MTTARIEPTLADYQQWRRFCAEFPEARDALILFAERTFGEEQWSKVQIPIGDELSPAVEHGLILADVGSGSFVDPYLTLTMSEYAAYDLLSPVSMDVPMLVKKTCDLVRREVFGNAGGLSVWSFVTLHNTIRTSILPILGTLRPSEHDHWQVLRVIAGALPFIQVGSAELWDALMAYSVVASSCGQQTRGTLGLSRFAQNQPIIAEELLALVLDDPGSVSDGVLCDLLIGLFPTNCARIFSRAEALITTGHADSERTGIEALSFFDYSGDERHSYINKTRAIFGRLADKSNSDVNAAIVRGYGELLHWDMEIGHEIAIMSARTEAAVQREVANLLSIKQEESFDQEWFSEALSNMKAVPVTNTEAMVQLDWVLYRLAARSLLSTMEFLEGWLLRQDVHKAGSGGLLSHAFDSTMSLLADSHRGVLERALTSWFCSNRPELWSGARDCVDALSMELPGRSRSQPVLDVNELNAMSVQDVTFVLRKICGYVFRSKALCSLATSVLNRTTLEDELCDYVVAMFIEYIGISYPGTTTEYLKPLATEDSKPGQVAKRILDHMNSYFEALHKLPRAQELEPISKHERIVHRAMEREMQNAHAEAERHASWRAFAMKMPVKGGIATLTEYPGQVMQKTLLKSRSFSVEFSRGDNLDPVGTTRLRLGWQLERRGGNAHGNS